MTLKLFSHILKIEANKLSGILNTMRLIGILTIVLYTVLMQDLDMPIYNHNAPITFIARHPYKLFVNSKT